MCAHWIKLSADNCAPAYKLHTQCHLNPWRESTFTDSLTPPYFGYRLVAEQQDVGYYIALMVGPEATLMDIGVAADFRRRGLGQQLLTHCLDGCKQQLVQDIWLEVRASNTAALTLYQGNGFDTVEQRKNYYLLPDGSREDAVIMKAELASV